MKLPDLGVGLVWWPALDPLCRDAEGLVDVIETEPETFWLRFSGSGALRSVLPDALTHLEQPRLLHGVGAPLGGTCQPSEAHIATLLGDIEAVKPGHVSEHLSFTHFRPRAGSPPVFAGMMLPPLQSQAGAALAATNIRRRREQLGGIPLAVENPVSYLPPLPGELPDGLFMAAVSEAADCGILLDLHNALCNARNGRQSVADFCASLPLERVWEVHLAGGEMQGDFYLDAHSGIADVELMEIAAELVPKLPNLRAIIFEIMPERVPAVGLEEIARCLARMKEIWRTRQAGGDNVSHIADPLPRTALPMDSEEWERVLGSALIGRPSIDMGDPAWWAATEPAREVYARLAAEGRASAIAAAAPRTTRRLLRERGGAATRTLLAEFWRHSPPSALAIDEARSLFRFLDAHEAATPGLSDAIVADEMEMPVG